MEEQWPNIPPPFAPEKPKPTPWLSITVLYSATHSTHAEGSVTDTLQARQTEVWALFHPTPPSFTSPPQASPWYANIDKRGSYTRSERLSL